MIRIVLPAHLKELAHVHGEVSVEVTVPVTQRSVLDALEAQLPVLIGRVRDHDTGKRRGFVRYYACQEDLSHEPADDPLPDEVACGKEPFLIVGSMAGG
jgi:hypothetical protein